MKYYLIAGEASGDLHGSNLMKAILQIAPDSEFRYWGGDKMQAVGGKLVKHYRDLAFMGFAEVLLNLHTIFSNLKYCKKDIVNYNPDILILIDYPGFNLRIAEFVKKQGIKVVYYISPQIWAWKRNRVFKIKKVVDKMLVILPFEKDFYAKYNVNVDFVGHPLLDAIENEKQITKTIFLSKNNLNNKSIIALLPGSRKQEVRAMLTTMLRLTNDYPNYQFIIAGINTLDRKFYSDIIGNNDIKLLFNNTNNILQFADAAIVTSGTATLETALIGTPEVVCYKGNSISYEIAKRVVRVKYISLVNLIMDKEVVVELIQKDFNYSSLKTALDEILFDDDKRIEIASNYKKLKIELGRKGASMRAAEIIVSIND
ncbi:MAG: lipid-A-disaccharide synthase [Bacteroidetes bacterium]|nr:lipid-A-disaccharide synthase [Bacteroidota bacterium]MBL6944319.1 lipid-A-disaccharide synthase [Bacteroidales bacterium]